ncbi:MAG: MerR family transcriptional regulator [Chloroflexi bacterium]|nr:MerR family transcriptional regulator [Chloroflexota bacterium]
MYGIKDVARATGRSIATVRRWERQGLIKPARRDLRTKARIYTEIDLLEIVHWLGRDVPKAS